MLSPRVERALSSMNTLADEARLLMQRNIAEESTTKSDGTPVTPTDLCISALVREYLRTTHPTAGLRGEEESFNVDAACLFVLDPVDGTAPFSAGLGVASFVMAYVEDGVTLAAVVEDPFTNTRFEAALGAGTTRNGVGVGPGEKPRSSIVLYEALRGTNIDELVLIGSLRARHLNPMRYGSFAAPSTRVATGELSGAVFARPSHVDVLAPALICQEAGAIVRTLSGSEVTGLSLSEGVLFAHPSTYQKLADALAASETRSPVRL